MTCVLIRGAVMITHMLAAAGVFLSEIRPRRRHSRNSELIQSILDSLLLEANTKPQKKKACRQGCSPHSSTSLAS